MFLIECYYKFPTVEGGGYLQMKWERLSHQQQLCVHEHQTVKRRLQLSIFSLHVLYCVGCDKVRTHAHKHISTCVSSPGWCAANTAACLSVGGGGSPGDRRCVHLPGSARLHPLPYTATQRGLKNAGSPSAESEGAEGDR